MKGSCIAALLCGTVIVLGCTATNKSKSLFINGDTVMLRGWISTRGEWALFPAANFENYNPYKQSNNSRCISLVNDTGVDHEQFAVLTDQEVSVYGSAVRFDDLAAGNDFADRVLSKKIYKNEIVENSCLRDFVFIVQRISHQ
jgi:hypothetical protein